MHAMSRTERTSLWNARLLTPVDVVRFVRAALGPWYRSRAAVVVLGLDGGGAVVGLAENRQRWTPKSLKVREMCDLAAELGSHRLILVQLVPDLRREPTLAEAQSFRALAARCASEGVCIVDCVVVSGERWWSLAQVLAERAARN
jgi:DNA repair protein RadC